MPNRDMREDFETVGSWFLPDTPARPVPGTLSFKAARIELELANSLRPLQSGPLLPELVRYPVVHGITQKQEAVSLFQCVQISHSLTFASGGFGQPETLRNHLAIVGALITEEQVFRELRCRIPGLQVWLSKRPIQTVKDSEGYAFRIRRVQPETITVSSIGAELDFKLEIIGKPSPSKATILASGWLHIRPSEPKLLSWFLEQLSTITNLLALLAEKPMPSDLIQLRTDQVGFPLYVLRSGSSKYCEHTQDENFFVSRPQLGTDLGPIVAKWLEFFPRVKFPVGLALSTMASDDLWLHVRFLSLLQALEGLHRALLTGNYMEAEGYRRVNEILTAAIPSDVSPDHRASLTSRIRYGNEISLAKRLKGLAELLPADMRTQIFGSGDVPRSWVDTRNYYTHWDEALRPNILSGQAMYDANVRLTIFLRTLYLLQADIPMDTLRSALSGRSDAAVHLQQLNSATR